MAIFSALLRAFLGVVRARLAGRCKATGERFGFCALLVVVVVTIASSSSPSLPSSSSEAPRLRVPGLVCELLVVDVAAFSAFFRAAVAALCASILTRSSFAFFLAAAIFWPEFELASFWRQVAQQRCWWSCGCRILSFLTKTPSNVQWDDHEVTNNWWPDEVIGFPQYEDGTAVNSLYHNSLQAFYEFNPLVEGQSIYRKQQFGAHLEIFFVDYRSFRDPNPENSNPEGADMMGEEQLEWLKQSLLESEATWKIISSHDPFGIVTGGPGDRDSFGQEDPAILGRELEFQDLISFIMDEDIKNVISLTSDVHFTGHVNMSPDRAEGGFTDFKPFDEYVIGPIHAGSFGPNFLDTSFGAQYEFELGPLTLGFERFPNFPPTEFNLQSFGYAEVSETGELTIQLIGIDGDLKYEVNLMPEV
eukprot:CAMPEP_0168738504 /NCGR_PEP_ID=MMETSP0724-20121128/10968_1 /TAXON_ID=265536 /ORGANISM="Amphiprora sp., Strain CCMP467" /LENGTH=417 /DNA_ID=CAMNT_0008785851 /DNA_START=38 /DNA_END=1291 /DNA_ORIENTATION=-